MPGPLWGGHSWLPPRFGASSAGSKAGGRLKARPTKHFLHFDESLEVIPEQPRDVPLNVRARDGSAILRQ